MDLPAWAHRLGAQHSNAMQHLCPSQLCILISCAQLLSFTGHESRHVDRNTAEVCELTEWLPERMHTNRKWLHNLHYAVQLWWKEQSRVTVTCCSAVWLCRCS